jgi:hypothetical protein
MTALNMTSFDSALKVHYTSDMIKRMTYQDHPLLALMPKYESFGGKNLPIPIIYGNPQGRSSSFAYAKANKKPGKYTDFVLTRAKDYGLCSIDGETIDASKGDKNAFMEAMTSEIDGTFESLTRSLGIGLYRSGSGSVGRIDATTVIASTLCVLSNPEDVVNFEVGQTIVSSTADGGGAVKVTGAVENSLEVVGVDRMAGTITLSANMDSFGAQDWALSDYLFVQGDYDSKIKGLDAWVPGTAPGGADNFFSVNRSVDTRLGGLRKDISAMPLEEGLIEGLSLASREGGMISHAFMPYSWYANLEKALGSKVQYVDVNTTVGVGFRGIQINNPKGKPVTVLADQDCIANTCFMLQMDTWKLYSLGQAPKLLNQDGNRVLRESDEDGVEVRTGYYAQVGCRAPGWNIRLKLA